MYAADISEGGEKAYPKDLKKRADINRWLLWESSVWFQSCYVYLVEYVVKPLLKQEPDEQVIEKESGRWNQLAGCLDDTLAKHKYITSDDVSIADIAIASCMHLHEEQRLPLDKHSNLKRWLADIEKLPCWQKTQAAVEKALVPNKQSNGTLTNGASHANDDVKTVRASLNYTKEIDKLTELYFYEDPAAAHIHEPGDDPREVEFHDGWSRGKEFDVDKHGFSLHDFRTQYPDGQWEDDERVRKDFYPEVVEFLKKELGAQRVLCFDHTIRSKVNAAKKLTQETNTSQRAPVRLVHCDYTAESGGVRVRQLLKDEADDLLSRRVAFVNVWKPTAKVEEMPLAMCDVTTSPMDDFFKLYLRYRDRTGENYVMRHSDKHKWWYFPAMEADKVIILKTFDNDQSRARFVGHSAFEDPTSKPDAPARESVEIRTICFF